MKGYYAFLYAPEDGGEWRITFPDLPGCEACGASAEEAARNAINMLSGHLAMLVALDEETPAPRGLMDILRDPALAQEREASLSIQMVWPRPVAAPRMRINIMLDPYVLRDTDEAAEAEGSNRSAFIERALKARLGQTG